MATTKKSAAKKTKKPAAKRAPAKKKASAKKAPAKKAGRKLRAGENPHPRRLKGALLFELRASALSIQLHKEKLETLNAKLAKLSMDPVHAELFKLLDKKTALVTDTKEATLVFVAVQKKLSDKFKIPLNKIHEYTFDTDTGAITPSKVAQVT